MPIRSKRKAREAALRALYEIELGRTDAETAMNLTLEEANLAPDIAEYAEKLIKGVSRSIKQIDGRLTAIVKDYDISRIAAVDRNVLRIGTFELFEMPEIPPAVTINEAIEIAKRYSTAESGRFVNGVLGRLLKDSPKADWDPSTAPREVEEGPVEESEPEIVEEVVQEGSEEANFATKYGTWKLRSGDAKIPANTEE